VTLPASEVRCGRTTTSNYEPEADSSRVPGQTVANQVRQLRDLAVAREFETCREYTDAMRLN